MSNRIDPKAIGAPFQLLAAMLVFIVLLDATFLGAARMLSEPAWLAPLLTIAAVLYPPLLLVGLFILQTRFREEMLDNTNYVQLMKMTMELDVSIDSAGVELASLENTESLPAEDRQRIRERAARLQTFVGSVEATYPDAMQNATWGDLKARASLQLARAAMSANEWEIAASHLEDFLSVKPDDWYAQFLLSVCWGNARVGSEGDEAALNAVQKAIDLMPERAEPSLRARAFAYKGGFLKRLERFEDALRALSAASELAAPGSYEADDVNYNFACVYAMLGKHDEALDSLRKLVNPRFVVSAAAHQHDYFKSMTSDQRFRELVDQALTNIDQPVDNLLLDDSA